VKVSRFSLAPIDLLLLLMVLIWGGNYSLVKASFAELPSLPFNALRLSLASLLFLVMLARRRPALLRRDWIVLVLLGFVGHFIYQLSWMNGLVWTSVANSALILGCSPVVVAVGTALMGYERIPRIHWVGAALSVLGIYLVVGHGAGLSTQSLKGDGLTLLAVVCWAFYTIGSRTLLQRFSPLVVTGYSMVFGTLLFLPVATPELLAVHWHAVSARTWASVCFSAVFALVVAYLVWYTAVQRIGNVRTSIYSNVTPIVAMFVAWVTLGEPLTGPQIAGATAILGGVGLTRIGGVASGSPPPEE
jgi:drug/metabolite transporter (DMT)-like permease